MTEEFYRFLREIEWRGDADGGSTGHAWACPYCGGVKPGTHGYAERCFGSGHKDGCLMAKFIAEGEHLFGTPDPVSGLRTKESPGEV